MTRLSVVVVILAVLAGVYAQQAVPRILQYQGKLTNPSGVALNGKYRIIFRLYNTPTGGSALWTEDHTGADSVQVTNGLFDVELGTLTALNIAFDDTYWIELVVNGETLAPRERLVAVPYAFRSIYADTARVVGSGAVQSDNITIEGDGTPANQLRVKDGGISNAKLAANAVTSDKIQDGTIVNADISNTANIAVTKLAAGSNNTVLTTNASGTVTWASQIPSTSLPALNNGQIWIGNASNQATGQTMSGDATISNTGVLDLTNNAVETSEIQDGAVTSAKIADGTIVDADISATAAIQWSKLASGSANRVVITNSSGVLTTASAPGSANLFLMWDGTQYTWSSSTTGLQNHIAGNGLGGANYNGSTEVTWDINTGNGLQIVSDAVALGPLTANWNQTGAFDIVLNNASSELQILESAGATYYGTIDVGDLSANRTYTFPDASGTVALGTGTANYNAYWTGPNTLGAEQYVAVSRGGTGVGTTPGNGQLLIGNGTGYTVANLTAGTGITITNGAGSIIIADANASSEVTGNGSANQVAYWTGSNTLSGITLTNGQLLIGSTGAAPVAATLTGTANEIDITNGAGSITIGIVDPLIATKGGTGQSAVSQGDLLYGSAANTWSRLTGPTSAGQYLRSTGANTFVWGTIQASDLPAHTHANLTFNNSGTGAPSGTVYNGSTAYTISYNTIGAAAATHTHATLTNGNGLTGGAYDGSTARTWAVNTGNGLTISSDAVTILPADGTIVVDASGVRQGNGAAKATSTSYRLYRNY